MSKPRSVSSAPVPFASAGEAIAYVSGVYDHAAGKFPVQDDFAHIIAWYDAKHAAFRAALGW